MMNRRRNAPLSM